MAHHEDQCRAMQEELQERSGGGAIESDAAPESSLYARAAASRQELSQAEIALAYAEAQLEGCRASIAEEGGLGSIHSGCGQHGSSNSGQRSSIPCVRNRAQPSVVNCSAQSPSSEYIL